MKSLLLWYVLAQAGDIATTAIALDRGCVEKFMLPSHPRTGLVIKSGAAFTVTVTLGKRDTKASRTVLAIGAASGTVGTLLNARTIPRCTHGPVAQR